LKSVDATGQPVTVVYLLPVVSQPRYWKRIGALESLGFEGSVLTFSRPYVQAREAHENRAEVIGSMSHGKYLRRLFALARALPLLYRRSRRADFLYCFGADLAGLGVAVKLFRRRLQLVLEVGDVRPVMIEDGVKGKLLRAVERVVLRHVSLIVVTSSAYCDRYFVNRQGVPADRILTVENKVDARMRELAEPVRGGRSKPGTVLSIGYFGLIRCRKSWDLLERMAVVRPDRIRIEVWGRLILDGRPVDLTRLPPNMAYHGEYRNPEDLPDMFSAFDIAWAAHVHGITNTRWARTNRYYEACCFGKPLIGQRGTLDGDVIDRLGIGFCIDLNNPDEAVDRICSVTDSAILSWQERVLALDKAVYQYTNEHAVLAQRMRGSRRDRGFVSA
jgi:succinoglycan biosynthesis protein ExoL